jgi:hypothetical protein
MLDGYLKLTGSLSALTGSIYGYSEEYKKFRIGSINRGSTGK